MSRPRIVIRPGKEKGLRKGYPWVFSNQIDRKQSDSPATGEIVRIESSNGDGFGVGLFHESSLIAVRFLTSRENAEIDRDFFAERVRRALDLRRSALPDTTHARLVFGESDGFPGTVVDRYGPPGYQGGVITWTCIAHGMEQFRESILDTLEEELRPDAIVERNDAPLREKDGLEQQTGILRGTLPETIDIEEGGVQFRIDVLAGPKTGFFIDQRLNRAATASLAKGRNVLDLFSADGAFALQALRNGASRAHLIDASEDANARARANAKRAGLSENLTTEAADALDRIGTLADEQRNFDLIILDPPGFASSRRHIDTATRAYQRLNISALAMLPPGGILSTSSCSQAIDEKAFERILRYSTQRAGARVRLLYRGMQPLDHPVLESMPETHYLKCYILQKLHDEVPG